MRLGVETLGCSGFEYSRRRIIQSREWIWSTFQTMLSLQDERKVGQNELSGDAMLAKGEGGIT